MGALGGCQIQTVASVSIWGCWCTHLKDQQNYLQIVQAHLEREKWLGIRFILSVYPEIRLLRPDLPFGNIDTAHCKEWLAARKSPLSESECEELGKGLTGSWKRVMKEGYWDRGIRKTYNECAKFWASEVELEDQDSRARTDAIREKLLREGRSLDISRD